MDKGWTPWGECRGAAGDAGGEGEEHTVAGLSYHGSLASQNAEQAARRWGEDKQTEALGEGLAAIAYALLDVAAAIRENTEAREQ